MRNIKKILFGITSAVVGLTLFAGSAFAKADNVKLNFGSVLNASTCNEGGAPVVNVTQQIINDADSGEAGNYWAMDTFTRTIQVWDQGGNTYCAIVRYTGSFQAIAGEIGPGGTGKLTGTETGSIEGGYQATITGRTLLATPGWPTQGSVGTTDYKCDSSGNCEGAVIWMNQYFNSGYTFAQPWWGWIYRGGTNGTWVNASTGNSGNIL